MTDEEHKDRVMREDRAAEILIGAFVIVIGISIGMFAHATITDSTSWYATLGVSGLFVAIGTAVLVSGIRS